jgi:hypothetical protein
VVCELDCVACSVVLGLCFVFSVVSVLSKNGFVVAVWLSCKCLCYLLQLCLCDFILIFKCRVIQLNEVHTVEMTVLLSIRDTQLVMTSRPKP